MSDQPTSGVRIRAQVVDFEHHHVYSAAMIRGETLLVVDDDADVLSAAGLLLKKHFSQVLTAQDPKQIETLMAEQQIDVFLLDMNFEIGDNTGSDGLVWLKKILAKDPQAVVILMTAFGDLNTAVQAMREGAADFVLKPWQNDKLLATLNVAAALRLSRNTVMALSEPKPVADFVAESEALKQVLRMVERVAPTDASVLIRGENGTGKELIAQALHRKSHRGHRALVAVDLGAVAESLFESELFGHKQGAFTDADRDRAGRFQAAHEGTLFLDEIGNLTLPLQNKLLRVLESREVTPLGGDKTITVDVRLISATNQPLDNMVTDGRFREDLLYRLNTIEIVIPPLRERLEDIPPLVEFFTSRTAKKYRLNHKSITPEALDLLTLHHWPGNVRELSHAVERALILSDKDVLDVSDFALTTATTVENPGTLNLEQLERRTITLALERANGNISHAAKALGITRNALYRRIEKFGL